MVPAVKTISLVSGKGSPVNGQRRHGTDTGIETEIIEIELYVISGKFFKQIPGHRILNRGRIDESGSGSFHG